MIAAVEAALKRAEIPHVAASPPLDVLCRNFGDSAYEYVVRYWLADSPRPDDARPQNEVDEVEWLPPESAASRLTYAHDLDVLRSALEQLER